MGLKDKIYTLAPNVIQNLMISMFNLLAYKDRYGKHYKQFLKVYSKNKSLTLEELIELQKKKFEDFISFAAKNTSFYMNLYQNIEEPYKIQNLQTLPILTKEMLRKNCEEIFTLPKNKAVISKTGGTTGVALEVRFTKKDVEERFAILDNFRNNYGYKLGEKTAWFSGKTLLNDKDIRKNRFWKSDYLFDVHYYSTFHISDRTAKYYLENLIKLNPKYIIGFPSSLVELARLGIKLNIDFPKGIRAIFGTAETITEQLKIEVEDYFKTRILNQYASSEGAPFIVECPLGKLHLELQSGVFEVLDSNNQQTKKGRLIVTSFTTHGTPLIRYDIGDEIELEEKSCKCGNNNPLVKEILGRSSDYLVSLDYGKINLGNISNTLKNVTGIIKMQVIQEEVNSIHIKICTDPKEYTQNAEKIFLQNWRERMGNQQIITIEIVEEIPNEKSGKFKMVINKLNN
jgi:phenylacetate-CoA ligase